MTVPVRPRLSSVEELRKALESAKAKPIRFPAASTAVVVRDPSKPDPQPAPAKARKMEPLEAALGGAIVGSALGDVVDEAFGVRTPGASAMILGVLGAIGAAFTEDKDARETILAMSAGSAAAGGVKMAAKFAKDAKPDPLVAMAHETLEHEEEKKATGTTKR